MSSQDELYGQATAEFGAALERIARGYEADADRRRDLLQQIHVALWTSFRLFDGRCSLGTWIYRVAHNTAISQLTPHRARMPALVTLEDIDASASADDRDDQFDRQRALERLFVLIHRLEPLDRQVILLYLEGMDAASIGEITAISPRNVATKVHRIKHLLARRFHDGGRDAG
jgi:RNA polymerase sigma-70 factor (ECF subfamily)